MAPTRTQQLEAAYHAVADLEGTTREEALQAHCKHDAALEAEVRERLEETRAAERFFAGLAARAGIGSKDSEDVLHHEGRRLGAYRLIRQIGRGGMGVVYLAERADQRFEKHVAIKVLPLGLVTREGRARFAREQAILARLEHPHIARLLDSGVTEEGTPYYVMEYIDGVPLDTYVEDNDLGLDARLDLFAQVCSAVGYAHSNLVIHRDIKPSNILVNREGGLKLLDFGVSKLIEEGVETQTTVTHADRRAVSPGYAAPELLQGRQVTTACDVYSLGVLLYELLTGQRPFDGDGGRTALVRRVLSGAAPRAPSQVLKLSNAALARRLRGDLDRIIAHAMGFEAQHRYPTVNALDKDLERHRAGLPVSAMPGHFGYHASRFVRRHWIGVVFSSVALVLLLALVAGSVYYAMRMGQQVHITQQERNKAQAVSAMLTEMFTSANPFQNQGEELSARQLADRGLRILEQHEQLSAETRAELLRVLGGVYASLSSFEMGRVLLAESARLERSIHGPYSVEYARIMADQAAWQFAAGDLGLALERVRTALGIYRDQARNSNAYADTLVLYARLLFEFGEFQQAKTAANEALALQHTLFGDTHFAIVQTMNLLGATMLELGRPDKARQLLNNALTMLAEVAPNDRAFAARIWANLGSLYLHQGKPQQALDWYQKALETRLAVFGPGHRETVLSRFALSRALHQLGRLPDAKDAAALAVSRMNDVLGSDHWLTARAEATLAEILTDLKKFQWADSLLEHALAVSIGAYGENHWQVAKVLLDQAELLRAQGTISAARQKLEHAEKVLKDLPTPSEHLEERAQMILAAILKRRASASGGG